MTPCRAILFVYLGCVEVAGRKLLRGPSEKGATAKVFFLFLARDGLPFQGIWERFFAPAQVGVDFHAFVHCVNRAACEQTIRNKAIFRTVDTVDSQWCDNLVGPMDQLLAAALKEPDAHPDDKFAFVSDSTAPIKSFPTILHRLTVEDRAKSNFCIWPRNRWGMKYDGLLSVKHDQWLTLTRQHATAIAIGSPGANYINQITVADMSLATRVGRFIANYTGTPWVLGLHVPGCVDEYLYFSLAFGWVQSGLNDTSVAGMGGSPLHLEDQAARTFQGRCDTYLYWGRDGPFENLTKVMRQDPFMIFQDALGSKHPSTFMQLSAPTLTALRESDFLFIRKLSTEIAFAVPHQHVANSLLGLNEEHVSISQAFEDYVFQPGFEQ